MTSPSIAPTPPAGLVRAQQVAKRIAHGIAEHVAVGVSEIELSEIANRLTLECGGDGNWTTPTTRVGIGTLVAHPDFPMQDRRASEGDTVIIDVCPTVDGWYGDYCISVPVGDAPEAIALIAEVRAIHERVISFATPGMPASVLSRAAEALFAEHGLRNFDLLQNIGHSIGYGDFASSGFIDAANDAPMLGAWTIEPQLGRFAAAAKFEDIVWLSPGHAPQVL